MLGSVFKLSFLLKKPLSLRRVSRSRVIPPPVACPELTEIWRKLAVSFFPDLPELLHFNVTWSQRRQKRVLASITVDKKLVRVARELSHPDYKSYLEPLLYHEMCHAVVGNQVEVQGGKRLWHGPAFKSLEANHPGIISLQSWIKSGGWSQAIRRERARTQKR